MKKSCYILEMSVQPGGSRKGEFFVYKTWKEIKHTLQKQLQIDRNCICDNAYHFGWYDQTAAIWVFEHGQLVKYIDLRPFITLSIFGCTFTVDQRNQHHDIIDENYEKLSWNIMDYDTITPKFSVNWDTIEAKLPTLIEPILEMEEEFIFQDNVDIDCSFDTYMKFSQGDKLNYGYQDMEY